MLWESELGEAWKKGCRVAEEIFPGNLRDFAPENRPAGRIPKGKDRLRIIIYHFSGANC